METKLPMKFLFWIKISGIFILFSIETAYIHSQNADSTKIELQSEYESIKENRKVTDSVNSSEETNLNDSSKNFLDGENANEINHDDEEDKESSLSDLYIIAGNYFHQKRYNDAEEIIQIIEKKGSVTPEVKKMKKYIEIYKNYLDGKEKEFNITNQTPEELITYADVFTNLSSQYPWNKKFAKYVYLIHFHLFETSSDLEKKKNSAFALISLNISQKDYLNTSVYLSYLKNQLHTMTNPEKSRFFYYMGLFFQNRPLNNSQKALYMFEKSIQINSGIYSKLSENASQNLQKISYR